MVANPQENQSLQAFEEKLASLEAEIAEKKIKLPPDIFEYVKEHFLALQRISRERKMPTEKDMEFMEHVRMWLSLDEKHRKKFSSIDTMLNSKEYREAVKRDITISQYTACVEIAEQSDPEHSKVEFSRLFKFPGDGRVVSAQINDIDINHYTGPLPENWEINRNFELRMFNGDKLPKNLKVGGDFIVSNCLNLKSIPDNFVVGGTFEIKKCPALAKIGEGLKVGKRLIIKSCHKLKELPSNYEVGGRRGYDAAGLISWNS